MLILTHLYKIYTMCNVIDLCAVIGDGDNSNGSSSSSNLKEYRDVIIGSCIGAFVLIVLICAIIIYIRSK